MIFTVINTIHSFWKSSSPTLLWPPARTLSLFTTTTALSEGRELWCVSREIGVQNCFYLKIPVVWSRSVEVCMEFEQVRFRKGEAVRLEGVSGSAEGNPLLQVPRNFLKDDFLKKKKNNKNKKHSQIVSQRLSSWTSQQWFFPDSSDFSFIHQCFQTLQTKWKNLAVDWDGGLPSIIWDLGIFGSIFEVTAFNIPIGVKLASPSIWKHLGDRYRPFGSEKEDFRVKTLNLVNCCCGDHTVMPLFSCNARVEHYVERKNLSSQQYSSVESTQNASMCDFDTNSSGNSNMYVKFWEFKQAFKSALNHPKLQARWRER